MNFQGNIISAQVSQDASTLSTEEAVAATTPLYISQHTSPPMTALLYLLSMGSTHQRAAATHANLRWPLQGKMELSFPTFLSVNTKLNNGKAETVP